MIAKECRRGGWNERGGWNFSKSVRVGPTFIREMRVCNRKYALTSYFSELFYDLQKLTNF